VQNEEDDDKDKVDETVYGRVKGGRKLRKKKELTRPISQAARKPTTRQAELTTKRTSPKVEATVPYQVRRSSRIAKRG
jgi:hypothetical protein